MRCICDHLRLPKMNGYEFVENLRNDEMYMDIPVIVMSSVIKETAKKQFSNLKIDAYIQKDMFNQVFFIDKVKEILSKHHI
jgi:two-component system chemotaxis sensor kinase CheA